MKEFNKYSEKNYFHSESITLDSGIKSVLFDMDGVILDSNSMKVNTVRKLLLFLPENEREGFITSFKRNFGRSRDFHFNFLHETYLAEKGYSLEFTEKLKKDYASSVIGGYQRVVLCDGVIKLLTRLKENNIDIYLITGSLQQDAYTVLKRLGLLGCFKGILGAPVNKTENIYSLLEKKQIESSTSVMIGDSVSDITSAGSHNIPTLFVEKYSLSDPYDIWSLGDKLNYSVVETLLDINI